MTDASIRDLAVRTDTALASLYREHSGVQADISAALDTRRALDKYGAYGDQRERNEKKIADLIAKANEIRIAMRPLEAIFNEHKWTRAFLVVGTGNGHVHRSMECATCYPTTAFAWLPEYSGGDESAIVEDAGERACTVCYPSAPVSILNRPTRIFSDDERAAQVAREERAAKKVARDAAKAAKAPTKDGTPLKITEVTVGYDGKVHTYTREINTEITARSEWMRFADRLTYLKGEIEIEATKAAMYAIEKALAGKYGVDVPAVREDLAIRRAKKMKKENR